MTLLELLQRLVLLKGSDLHPLAGEVMMGNFPIRNNIRRGKTGGLFQILQTIAAEGMQTTDQSLPRLCRDGRIDYQIAKPFIYDKGTHDSLKSFVRRPSLAVPPGDKRF